jgi:hypothetical protein
MLFRSLGFIFLAAALSACSRESAPTAPTTSTPASPASVRVSGRVVDYATGQSVPGYTVRWWTGSNSHLMLRFGQLASVTDATGRFTVDVPVTDDFTPLTDTLLFDIPMASGGIRIPAKSIETDLIVNPGTCAARYGYVFDAVTRQPIFGARVARAGTATTDANGYYRIDIGCEPRDAFYWGIGTTTIGASHPAYQGTFEFDGRREGTSYSGIRRVDFALQPLR